MDDQEAYVAPTRGSRIEVVCVMERYRSEFVQVVSTQMSDQALSSKWDECGNDATRTSRFERLIT